MKRLVAKYGAIDSNIDKYVSWIFVVLIIRRFDSHCVWTIHRCLFLFYFYSILFALMNDKKSWICAALLWPTERTNCVLLVIYFCTEKIWTFSSLILNASEYIANANELKYSSIYFWMVNCRRLWWQWLAYSRQWTFIAKYRYLKLY